jgi:hypothetical protein
VERGAGRVVDMTAIGPAVQQLVRVDMEAGELVVAGGLKNLLIVGLDGRVRRTLPTPPDVEPQPQTFRFLADGWRRFADTSRSTRVGASRSPVSTASSTPTLPASTC